MPKQYKSEGQTSKSGRAGNRAWTAKSGRVDLVAKGSVYRSVEARIPGRSRKTTGHGFFFLIYGRDRLKKSASG